MTHDYKDLIQHMEDMAARKGPDMELTGASIWLGPAGFAMVLHALKVADKIMQEPSEAMLFDATNYDEDTQTGITWEEAEGCFIAMRDQMLKEIENDASL